MEFCSFSFPTKIAAVIIDNLKKITMKYLLLIFLLGCSALQAQSQQVKLYAYSRVTTPGIIPDPNNDRAKQNTIELPKAYYIYAEVKKGARIKVAAAFIDGRYYAVSARKVKTPVIKDRYEGVMNSDQKDILVKKTSNDVYEIIPGDECSNFKDKKTAEAMRKTNAVMLVMNYNQTKLYPALPVIKTLTPVQGM